MLKNQFVFTIPNFINNKTGMFYSNSNLVKYKIIFNLKNLLLLETFNYIINTIIIQQYIFFIIINYQINNLVNTLSIITKLFV